MTLPHVVSLLPGATDIMVALGVGDMLVAVTHECDMPSRFDVPRVTSTPIAIGAAGDVDQQVRETAMRGESLFHLDEHRIAASRPDVILTQALCEVCAVSENDVRALAARLAPPPRIVTLSGTTLATVFDDIRAVAIALNLAPQADELIAGFESRMHRIHHTLTQATAPRPRVAVIEWTDPIYAAGHWVPELITRAGGIDVLATPGEHSTTRTVADVRDANPDIVIFAQCGYITERAAAEATTLLAQPAWAWARNTSVWAIDANSYTSRPGPRIVDGVEIAAAVIHPSLFPPPHPTHAQRVI